MTKFPLRACALALAALWPHAPVAAQDWPAVDPQLLSEARAIELPAPLPPIRMIGERVYAELPASASAPARWAYSPLDAYLAGKPVWTTALDLTPPKGEARWTLAAVHCLGPAQAHCLLQPGPGDGRTELLEYDVAANRIVAEGFARPLGRRDLDWDDVDHVLVSESAADALNRPSPIVRWRRGTPLAGATPWFAAADPAGRGLWPNRMSDTAGSLATLVSQDMGGGKRRMWIVQRGRTMPLALPDDAWLASLIQGQAVVTTGDTDWAAGGVPAHSVAALPLAQLPSARPGGVRTLFTAGEGQQLDAASVSAGTLFVVYKDLGRGRVRAFAWGKHGWVPAAPALPETSAFRFAASNDAHDFALFTEGRYGADERRWQIGPGGQAHIVVGDTSAPAGELSVRHFVARAPDGTRLPYFVIARSDVRPDAPVLVTGSGGWGEVREPGPFSRFASLWTRRGGVLVDTVVRGGGEFGEAWHQAATGARRAVSFADFRVITDDLVARGLAREGRMGLVGGDHFGLIALDAVISRPGRWRAVWLADPIADLEHAATLGVGEADRASYAAEYGDPADPAVTAALRAANPLAHLPRRGPWPATLVTRAHEDPYERGGHSAALAAAAGAAGLPLRVEEIGGDYDRWYDSAERAALGAGFFIAAGLDPSAPQ